MNLLEFGQRIRNLREKRRLKQADIAHALQISAQAVSKWERGENAPDIAILLDLSSLLGVTTDWLLGRTEDSRDTFQATVFCTSLNGFARKATEMQPVEVASWANGLFHLVTEAVLAYDGVPVKYVGDGFLGFFSGGGHADRACKAARQAKTTLQSRELIITLHAGEIYLGSIGHHDYARPDIIGEPVNTAFLANQYIAEHFKSGLGLTRQVVACLNEALPLKQPHAIEVKGLREKLDLYEFK